MYEIVKSGANCLLCKQEFIGLEHGDPRRGKFKYKVISTIGIRFGPDVVDKTTEVKTPTGKTYEFKETPEQFEQKVINAMRKGSLQL